MKIILLNDKIQSKNSQRASSSAVILSYIMSMVQLNVLASTRYHRITVSWKRVVVTYVLKLPGKI